MARKPCAQDVAILEEDCSIECKPTGRFRRIARNAILPFYYDCNPCIKDANIDKINRPCKKVFYIKNPKFFAGADINDPASHLTYAIRYSHTARNNARVVDGRRKTKIIEPKYLCSALIPVNWYSGVRETIEFNYYNNLRDLCICPHPGGRILRN